MRRKKPMNKECPSEKPEVWICLHCGKTTMALRLKWDDIAYKKLMKKTKEEQKWELENKTVGLLKPICQQCNTLCQMVELEKVLDQPYEIENRLTTLREFIVNGYKMV